MRTILPFVLLFPAFLGVAVYSTWKETSAGPTPEATGISVETATSMSAVSARRKEVITGTAAVISSPEVAMEAAPATLIGEDRAASGHVVKVYYLHWTLRCPACLAIEANVRELLENEFAPLLELGEMEFEVLDAEKRGNEHFVEDYEMSMPTLIVADFNGGRRIRWKTLEDVWELVDDSLAFRDYVGEEIHAYIEGGGWGGHDDQ